MKWTDEETSAFLDETDIAETVYYYPCYGNPDVRAVWEDGRAVVLNFQEPFEPSDIRAGDIEQISPSAYVRLSDVLELQLGDVFFIRGEWYNVVSMEPDASGFTIIKFMRKAA